jgi:hypothetical protein
MKQKCVGMKFCFDWKKLGTYLFEMWKGAFLRAESSKNTNVSVKLKYIGRLYTTIYLITNT